MGITISYFRRYSGESERISNLMKHIKEKQTELALVEKEEESEDEEDYASQYYGRLQEGREYLMSVASDEVTVEDALEAFGFGRNGLII
jgi:hypothetical protein